jgi:hypothetical protein
MTRVVILGCGPAGLFAAHAAECAGADVEIIGRKRKSEMFGAQYLHAPIPEVNDGDVPFRVTYRLRGTVEGYRDKVYGPGFREDVSPEALEPDHDGWNIRAAYDLLWMHYQGRIVDQTFDNPGQLHDMIGARTDVGHWVSSIPAPLLCSSNMHGFQAQQVWALGDAPERGQFSPITTALNEVVCSGEKETSWYRCANILGYNTVEWPNGKKPPIEGVTDVLKPTGTNCDCLPMVHRIGRYGKWTKGVLSHSAFFETYHGIKGEPWQV